MRSALTRALGVCAGAAALVIAAGTAASAGEYTGNGQPLEVKGASICAYSGQNDGFHDPEHQEFEGDDGRVQSFGQIVKAVGPLGGVPGTACNPNSGGH